MKNNNFSKLLPNILLYGVLISSTLIIVGLIKLILENNFSIYYEFSRNNIFSFNGVGIINIGLFILILTPIIRVISMLINYILENNKLYIIISLIVLSILFISLVIGLNN